jgi:ParB family transcriptional regulator, chromosome partitioning protein
MHYSSISINNIKEGHSCRRNYVKKEDLKTSITTTEGLLEPISVRQQGEDYIVIDGLRRLRAVKELGWDTIDCSILDIDEEKSYLISYIKNTQRNNLNPIEDARHLQTVKERFGYNHEDLVRRGYARHRSTLDDKTRLLTLPDKIQDYIAEGSVIGPSIGYEIANLKDADLQIKLAEEIIARGGMPVRWVKDKVKSLNVPRNGRDKLQEPPVQIPHGEIPGVFFKDASDMSELKDKSVGLIVTSPPYGVGMQYEKGVSFEEHRANLEKVFSECNRVLKPGGKTCINFGDIETFGTRTNGKPEIQLMGGVYQEILRKHGLRLTGKITWKKCTKGKRDFNWSSNPQANYHDKKRHTTYKIINNTEYIHIFEKDGKPVVDPDLNDRSKVSKETYYSWNDGVWGCHRDEKRKRQMQITHNFI